MSYGLLSAVGEQWNCAPVWLKATLVGGGCFLGAALVKRLVTGALKRDSPVKKDFEKGCVPVSV